MKTRIFHGYPAWQMSGVNVWSVNMACESFDDPDFEHSMLITGVPAGRIPELDARGIAYTYLAVPPSRRRHDEWKALKDFLESNAPCIYLPNYDFHRASALGTLSREVRVCSVVHSDEACYYNQLTRVGRACDAIVAVSEQIEKTLHARFPDFSARVRRIPYGVPEVGPRQGSEATRRPMRLAYCNRLAKYQKRVLDLPEVCRELVRLGTDFHLTVAGEGPDERELEAKFKTAGVADRVTMTGRLGADAVRDLLLSSDVFLLTSDFEGLPMSLLEAMACGCVPVVYEIASGVRDAVKDGSNGILARHGEPLRLADGIHRLDSDRDFLSRLSRGAIQTHAERFSVHRMATDYRLLFSDLMTKPRIGVARDGRIRRPRDLKLYYRALRKVGLVRR
ncbi:MAG: glycosyltransferase family 4 protein [Chthoniobacterales bacterium]